VTATDAGAVITTPPAFNLRPLQAADATAFHALRMQALQAHPHAFASSAQEQAAQPLATLAQRLQPSDTAWVLGAWTDHQLVGTIGLQRHSPTKLAHKAQIWGVYVDPAHRKQGIAQALLTSAVAHACTMPGLQQLQLSVSSHNHAAIALYQRAGFVRFAVEPRSLQVNGVYYDEDWMALTLAAPHTPLQHL
jgi:RimJ/RimL family protein N-acetyltransferase